MNYGNCTACGGLRQAHQLTDGRCGECTRESQMIQRARAQATKPPKYVPKIMPGSIVRHDKFGIGKVIDQWEDMKVLDVVFGRELHSCRRKHLKLAK
jgi:hypothetical protein